MREVSIHYGIKLVPGMSSKVTLRGEAVVVDLGKRGAVFALLRGMSLGTDHAKNISRYAFGIHGGQNYKNGDVVKKFDASGKKAELLPAWYPQFVYFRNPDDPTTVENLLEYKSCADKNGVPNNTVCLVNDHFSEAFGDGVKLKSVTVEMTNEAVDFSIEKYLKWLPEKQGVAGVIGSTKEKMLHAGSLGLTGVEFTKGKFW